MKVVSLFDGISVGLQALKNLNIPVTEYHSFEIDKYAMAISEKNHPEIIRHGSVVDVDYSQFKDVDLLMGGSPCQGFSFSGKQLAFDDPRSKLFFEFSRALKEINPKYFLLENVMMKQEYIDIISKHCDIAPIKINSSLLSAQNRKRLYWTNIPNITQPEDKGILLKDIVHENVDDKYYLSEKLLGGFLNKKPPFGDRFKPNDGNKKTPTLTARYYKMGITDPYYYGILNEYIVPFDKTLQILEKEVERGKIKYLKKDSQGNKVYFIHDKVVTISDKTEPYLFGCITPDKVNKRQNGQRFNDDTKFYTLTTQDKHGILIEGYIRKLTPIECCRLQTLPDDYCDAMINGKSVSNTQKYKVLGNGWTCKVIEHILGNIK